jgi:hypothetical protein
MWMISKIADPDGHTIDAGVHKDRAQGGSTFCFHGLLLLLAIPNPPKCSRTQRNKKRNEMNCPDLLFIYLFIYLFCARHGPPPKRRPERRSGPLGFWLAFVGGALLLFALLVSAHVGERKPEHSGHSTQLFQL